VIALCVIARDGLRDCSTSGFAENVNGVIGCVIGKGA
jgi:hypothetical protein